MPRIRFASLWMPVVLLTLSGAAFAQAPSRNFIRTNITLDLATNTPVAEYETPTGKVPIATAKSITDGAFVMLDLKIIVPQAKADLIRKEGEQSFRPEPARCSPTSYGSLEMEDGLRYFFDLPLKTQGAATERVQGEIYPGNRSTHWHNDVFCEYDPTASGAIFRVTGFFYVIHRKGREVTSIQLRPVSVSLEEALKYLDKPQ